MSLAQKLVLYALAIALLPLVATGFSLIRQGQGALRERIVQHQQAAAVAVAAKVSQAVESLAQRVASVMEMMDATALSKAERQGLMRMLYRQSDDITSVVLVDPKGGGLAPAVYLTPQQMASLADGDRRVAGDRASVERVYRQLAAILADQPEPRTVLMSPVYFPAGGAARVAVAVPCCWDEKGAFSAAAGIEIILRNDVLRIEGIGTGEASQVFVVDHGGRSILHPTRAPGDDLTGSGAVATFLRIGESGTAYYSDRDSQKNRFAAFAPVGQLGWGVVVEQPEEVAFAAAAQMQRQTLIWILATAAFVIISGLLFAGRLRSVLAHMVSGARAYEAGELTHRIEVRGGDELSQLADTLNQMAIALEISYGELETWNRTLEDRVDQRTRELKEAQAEMLQQSKLAAIGQLGAGMAHEINNPLAAALGMVQILLARKTEDDPERKLLVRAESAAKRCKVVVANLLRFSERGVTGRQGVCINELVGEVVGLIGAGFERADIRLLQELGDELPEIHADHAQISLAILNVLANAKNASEANSEVSVITRAHAEGIEVTIVDRGHGIAAEHLSRVFEPFFTNKSHWTGVGLGLSVAYRIVADHGGHIDIESEVEKGTTVRLYLPKDPPEPIADEGERDRGTMLA